MTDSQTWTIIAAMVALVGVVSVLFFRSQRAMMAGIDARFDAVDARFAAMDAKFEAKFAAMDAKFEAKFVAMDSKFEARFEAMDAKIDGLGEVMEARFTDVDHRLSNVEDDMRLVKAHLIEQRSA